MLGLLAGRLEPVAVLLGISVVPGSKALLQGQELMSRGEKKAGTGQEAAQASPDFNFFLTLIY